MRKILIAALVLVLLASAVLVVSSANAAKKPVTPGMVIWSLTKIKVIDSGQTITGPQGTFINGYVIEAQAKAKKNQGKVFPNGTFRLTLSLFSPAYDMPGQKAGMWYVQGEWSVVTAGAKPEETQERHNAVTITGKIKTELEFNPIAEKSEWTALASLPMAPIDGQWARGDGTLSLNKKGSGDLFLDLELWPVQP